LLVWPLYPARWFLGDFTIIIPNDLQPAEPAVSITRPNSNILPQYELAFSVFCENKNRKGRKRFFEKERGSVFALQATPRQVGSGENFFPQKKFSLPPKFPTLILQ